MERRQFSRVSSNFALEVHPSDVGEATGQNVSKGGIMFVHKTPIDAGKVLELTLRVPSLSGSVKVKAKVVRCEKSGNSYNVAVNFVNVDEESEKSIVEMLESF